MNATTSSAKPRISSSPKPLPSYGEGVAETAPASTRLLPGMVGREAGLVEEEALVVDARSVCTPAELVERKLVRLLKSNLLPVSHLLRRSGGRGHNPLA